MVATRAPLSDLCLGKTAFQRARTDIYPLAYAASVLELNHSHDESQVRAAAAHASRSPRCTTAHVAEQLNVIVAHIQTLAPPIFDARDYIEQYKTASAKWHASLASGLRLAYGRAKQHKRSASPHSAQTTGPERTRLAMRICHHWYKLEHAQWGSAAPLAPRDALLRRLHHVRDASVTWGTAITPPEITPDWGTNDRSTWGAWALDVIPIIHRFLILSGVAHVKGTFCTHPIGNEIRLPNGPSLGGALRPGGTTPR